MEFPGSGFRVEGLGLGFRDLGLRVWSSGLRARDLGLGCYELQDKYALPTTLGINTHLL